MKKIKVLACAGLVASLFFSQQTMAVNMANAGWYLHLDVQKVRNSDISKIVDKHDGDVQDFLDKVLGHEMNQQMKQLTVYGEKQENKDITVLIQGGFTNSAKQVFFSNVQKAKDYSATKLAGQLVHQWLFDGMVYSNNKDNYAVVDENNYQKNGEDHDKEVASIKMGKNDKPIRLYATEIDKSLVVISTDIDEVKSWIKGVYSEKQLKREGVLTVVVNLDKAMAHGAIDFDKNNMDMGFDSNIMKKVNQLSFSVAELKDSMHVEVGMVTKDEKVAQQVKNIVNGLLALKSLSEDNLDDEVKPFLDGLNVNIDGVNVLLTSDISISDVNKMLD